MCTQACKDFQKLEAEVRRLRRTLFGVVACAGVLVFSGAQKEPAARKTNDAPIPNEISAHSLHIKSKSGKTLAWLGETDDATSFGLFDGRTTSRDGGDILRANLYAAKNGEAGISLTDREGRMRTRLSLDEKGHPEVWFTNESGHDIFQIGELEKGGIGLSLNNSDGTESIELATQGDGSAALEIHAKDHDGAILVSVTPDGKPVIGAKDRKSTVRANIGLAEDGAPFVLIFDKEGKLIFRYPN